MRRWRCGCGARFWTRAGLNIHQVEDHTDAVLGR